jgi:hypothetical protein
VGMKQDVRVWRVEADGAATELELAITYGTIT